MVRWAEFEREVPEFAGRVKAVLDRHKHKTMATLRADGAPRISGAELQFAGRDVFTGSMPDAVKGRDLRRDPRVAFHSRPRTRTRAIRSRGRGTRSSPGRRCW